jgi:hypothetical protein
MNRNAIILLVFILGRFSLLQAQDDQLSLSFVDKENIVHYSNIVIMVQIVNQTNKRVLLPNSWENAFLTFDFEDKKVLRVTKDVQYTFPQKKDSYNLDINCNLPENMFNEILPWDTVLKEVDLSDLYFGFHIGKKYKLEMELIVPEDFTLYCPDFFTPKVLSSNTATLFVEY